jgi:predicted GIY-YIG superfamily endonuclease
MPSCSRCGRDSHTARNCYAKTAVSPSPAKWAAPKGCTRCGRDSHTARECYAKTEVQTKNSPTARKRQAAPSCCARCGRDSHATRDCYAVSTASGMQLAASPGRGAKAPRFAQARTASPSSSSSSQSSSSSHSSRSSQSASSSSHSHSSLASSSRSSSSSSSAFAGGRQSVPGSCTRCGRDSHTARDCFASTRIGGQPIGKTAEVVVARPSGQTIYSLELENGKYYVGKTKDIEARVQEHTEGDGAAWTRKWKPRSFSVLREDVASGDVSAIETQETAKLMKLHGIDNVRGGQWTRVTLSNEERVAAVQHIKHQDDLCNRCGRQGHFASACFAKSDVIAGKKI